MSWKPQAIGELRGAAGVSLKIALPNNINRRGVNLMLNSFLRTARGARAALAVVPLACAVFSGSGWAEPIATQASTIPDLVASHAAVPAGAPPADQSMHIVVSLPLRNMEQLDALLPAIYDPQSPSYHNYLSVAEFTDRFGPSARDYDSAIAFFSQNGFKVGPRAANRYLIALDGKVSDVERVFHVTMGLYRHPTEGRNFMAPDRLPTLDLKTPIQQVIGLDDFVLPYRHLVRGESDGKDHGFRAGRKLHRKRHSRGLLSRGYAHGRRAVHRAHGTRGRQSRRCEEVLRGRLRPEELRGHRPHLHGWRAGHLHRKLRRHGAGARHRILDLDGAGLEQHARLCRQHGGGRAQCDGVRQHQQDPQHLLGLERELQDRRRALQGVRRPGPDQSHGERGLFLAHRKRPVAGRGRQYHRGRRHGPRHESGGRAMEERNRLEPAVPAAPPPTRTSAIESYQLPYIDAANGGSTTLRNVPDVAASADTDMYICADGSCAGGWGGTSFASPIWAGFIALANQQAVANGQAVVGFINPAIYALGQTGNYSKGFHDITKGKSGKFSCTVSYDLVTGLGSPKGQGLIDLLVP